MGELTYTQKRFLPILLDNLPHWWCCPNKEVKGTKKVIGSSVATAAKKIYIATTVFNPCNSGFKYNCRIIWHFVWFYGWWSKPDFWWSKSTSFNWGLFCEVGFRIKSEKSILPIFYFFSCETQKLYVCVLQLLVLYWIYDLY